MKSECCEEVEQRSGGGDMVRLRESYVTTYVRTYVVILIPKNTSRRLVIVHQRSVMGKTIF